LDVVPWDSKKYKNTYVRNIPTKGVKQVMNDMFKQYQLSGKMREKQILNAWSSIMGETIAKRTSKKFMKNGVLFVSINSAPLKNDLMLSKEKIIAHYEETFEKGILKDITFL